MHINLLLIPFIIILGLLMGTHDTQRKRKWYIVICGAVLVFVAAMRSPEWMTFKYSIDTLVYKEFFEQSFDMSWGELWTAAVGRYVGLNDEADIGFMVLNKFIGFFTHDFHIYSMLADLIFFIPFGMILYRFCSCMKQVIFAFVFYVALVQVYFFGGARQIFAIGFDMMALLAMMDRKQILSVMFLLISVSIHFSSILFSIPLLMIWFDAKAGILKSLHAACLALFPIVLIMPNEIITFMGNVIGMEKYAEYGAGEIQGGASTFIILIELLSLFCLVAIKKEYLLLDRTLKCFYVMAPLFTFFAPLIRSNGSMIRITLYYSLFLTVLVPYAIDCMFDRRENSLAYIIAIGALAFLAVSDGGMTYYFYWQV